MSKRKIESLRRLMRRLDGAWNSRDVEALVAACDPSVELHPALAGLGAAQCHGHAGVRDWFRDMEDAWGEAFRIEPEAFVDLCERTLGFYTLRGRGRHSGVDVAMPYAAVFGWHDDLVISFKGYRHREDLLGDLGVTEDELEPIAP
jgi:hypothetical protein